MLATFIMKMKMKTDLFVSVFSQEGGFLLENEYNVVIEAIM